MFDFGPHLQNVFLHNVPIFGVHAGKEGKEREIKKKRSEGEGGEEKGGAMVKRRTMMEG